MFVVVVFVFVYVCGFFFGTIVVLANFEKVNE